MFRHVGGVKNTFTAVSKRRSGDVAGAMIAGIDESARSFMQATMDYMEVQSAINRERRNRNQDVKANNRKIYIEYGMDPDASEDDQESFATLYGEASRGDADGYLGLAAACWFGRFGALINKAKAAKYYRLSIEKGLSGENLSVAEYRLAICYFKGYGVVEDDEKAMCWLNRSARHGNIEAKKLIARLRSVS